MRIYNWEMAEGWQTFSKILTQRDFDDVDEFMPVLAKFKMLVVLRSKPEPIIQVFYAIFSCAHILGISTFIQDIDP